MRALALALLLTACEASAPVNAYQADTPEVTDPYGDSGDSEPVCLHPSEQRAECQKLKQVPLNGDCVTLSWADYRCKKAGGCYSLTYLTCITCVQP